MHDNPSPNNTDLGIGRPLSSIPLSSPCKHIRVYVGLVGVGWRRRCKTRLSLGTLDNHSAVFFILAASTAGGRVRSFRGEDNLISAQGELSHHVVCV